MQDCQFVSCSQPYYTTTMWFLYSLAAMSMLVARRSTEKTLSDKIPSSALAWLQQATALPFAALMLPFAVWINPAELSSSFVLLLALYTLTAAVDLMLYYKAIQIGDISIIAPLLNLTAVTGIISSYLLLGQKPSLFGILAASFIVCGAYFVTKHRKKHLSKSQNNSLAILIVLGLVVMRAVYSPLEVTLLRESNPIYLNFISSLLIVPVIIAISVRLNRRNKSKHFTKQLRTSIVSHKKALAFIGLTMAINIFFSLTAKQTAPNAGYVTAIKGAQVVPMAFIGVFLFKEHVAARQWIGIACITCGLVLFLFS